MCRRHLLELARLLQHFVFWHYAINTVLLVQPSCVVDELVSVHQEDWVIFRSRTAFSVIARLPEQCVLQAPLPECSKVWCIRAVACQVSAI